MIDRRHNGGPALDDDENGSRHAANPSANSETCRWCRHSKPPPERDERDYEAFRNGVTRRRVKRPAGACDRVRYQADKPVAFSATVEEFSCLNFEAKSPAPRPKGGGWVTIWSGNRILWQGREEDAPDEQTELKV